MTEHDIAGTKTLSQAQVVNEYPTDIRALPVIYSNHIGLIGTPEEVLLEISQLQPQTANPGTRGVGASISATVVARIVLTKGHAKRFAELLLDTLRKIEAMPEVTIEHIEENRDAR